MDFIFKRDKHGFCAVSDELIVVQVLLLMYLGVNIMQKRNFVVRSCYNTGIEFFF